MGNCRMPCHCNCTGCCFPQQYSAIDKKKGPDVVVYKRGGTTYVYNLEHKWTFEEEIVLSKISRDNKRLFYKTWEGSLKYIDLTAEKDIQTIDSSVINFVISENGDVVYYIKRDLDVNQLFKWTKGKSLPCGRRSGFCSHQQRRQKCPLCHIEQ